VFSEREAIAALQGSGERPAHTALYHDGTPTFVWNKISHQTTETRRVVRRAGEGLEAFAIRAYVKIGGVEPFQLPVVAPQRPMKRHRAEEIFTAIKDFFPNPVEHKKHGIRLISSHADRGGGDAINRKLFAWFDEYIATLPVTPTSWQAEELTWPEGVPCACHDVHNSFLHALDETVDRTGEPRKAIARATFKTVRSLREMYGPIVARMAGWMIAHLSWSEEAPDIGKEMEWWLLLGIPDDCAESLSRMGLCFSNGRLRCFIGFQGTLGFYDLLIGNLITVYHVRGYSMTRWASSGHTHQTLLATSYLGMDSVIAEMQSDPEEPGEYWLSGYNSFSQNCRFCCSYLPF